MVMIIVVYYHINPQRSLLTAVNAATAAGDDVFWCKIMDQKLKLMR